MCDSKRTQSFPNVFGNVAFTDKQSSKAPSSLRSAKTTVSSAKSSVSGVDRASAVNHARGETIHRLQQEVHDLKSKHQLSASALAKPQFAKQSNGDRARVLRHIEDTIEATNAAGQFRQGPDYADYCTANLHANMAVAPPDNPSGARFKYVALKGTFTQRIIVGPMGTPTSKVTIALTPQGYMYNTPFNAFYGLLGDNTRKLGILGAWLEGAAPAMRANPSLEFNAATVTQIGNLPVESGMDYAIAFSGGKAQLHVSVPGDGAATVAVYDAHQTKAYGLSAGYESLLRQNPDATKLSTKFGMNPNNYPSVAIDSDFTYALPEVFSLVGTSQTSSFTSATAIAPNKECFTFSNPRFEPGIDHANQILEFEDRCGNVRSSEYVGSGMWVVQNASPNSITVTVSGTYAYNARVSVASGLIYDMGQFSNKHSNDRRILTKFVNEFGATGSTAGALMLDPSAISQRAGMASQFKLPPGKIPRDLHKSFLDSAKSNAHSFAKTTSSIPIVGEFASAADSVLNKGWGGVSDMFTHGKEGLSQLAAAVSLIEEIGSLI